MEKKRTYSELQKLNGFEEKYKYLKLEGEVGKDTFGFDRYLNQVLYREDPKWKSARNKAILRDNGCDLGEEGHEIKTRAIVHHMNPITPEMVINHDPDIYNLEYLITTTHRTHNAIHYGDESQLEKDPVVRTPNDTTPWKKGKENEKEI